MVRVAATAILAFAVSSLALSVSDSPSARVQDVQLTPDLVERQEPAAEAGNPEEEKKLMQAVADAAGEIQSMLLELIKKSTGEGDAKPAQ